MLWHAGDDSRTHLAAVRVALVVNMDGVVAAARRGSGCNQHRKRIERRRGRWEEGEQREREECERIVMRRRRRKHSTTQSHAVDKYFISTRTDRHALSFMGWHCASQNNKQSSQLDTIA